MPRYDYFCPSCRLAFEAFAGHNDRFVQCACGSSAERRPFSGVPNLKGETVAKSIPDESYRWDAMKREHRAKGWDEDRAVRFVRKGLKEDNEGHKILDLQQAANAS